MTRKIRITLATDTHRHTIYSLRHDVYARELGQHPENPEKALRDSLDPDNLYIVATIDDAIAGFISITPPHAGKYSIDKYLRRDEIPFAIDAKTWELRILTVLPAHRGTLVAMLLMYAAFRWVEASGGTRIIAIGRREIRDLYLSAGLQAFGRELRSGSVDYMLMSAPVSAIRERAHDLGDLMTRMESQSDWDLIVPFHAPANCFHGGAFFNAIGDEFDHLERTASVINADVLDAWFPPSPRVLAALDEHLPWLLRTSPPTGCEGLTRTIARTRGVDATCVLPGAGSSDLIFLALRHWLKPTSRVLLPEPAYGEYAHVLEKVIRCRVDRLVLDRANHYDVDLAQLERASHSDYDLIVLVNPNSPTGRHIPRHELESLLRRVPASTLVWIDETYIDYVGAHESLEEVATTRPNVVICKSMSKVYALSGVRAAYLCASPHLVQALRAITPPWAVSLPAQVAAVAALHDSRYYAERYHQTHALRTQLAKALSAFPSVEIVPGTANFVLFHVAEDGPTAGEITMQCRKQNLFIRDASTMGTNLGHHALRIAVKDEQTTNRMIEILAAELRAATAPLSV
ncbi:MAG TPA: aminotransferase class I/II-fold pyridoxal phosphate-dependent enzyme [Thermoanaerobaculia bacterium]|jgi:histidinol-phosphate/aromatic aminotransferase/cobyric acid decarboxylase-like protein/GNAT superfamily N-acetyltransferase|nr:aminotransferase class I/II-fold pyridoxal phosphate-dependent enzyme [Thermoanaerobaculia bacterium]